MTCRIATVCLWMCIHIVLSFIYGMEHMPSQKALLLLSHVEHGTYLTMQMQCCTRKPFWVAKPEPQSCSSSAFPHFEADAEIGVYDLSKWSKKGRKAPKWAKVTRMIKELRLTFIHPADIGRASHLYFAALNIWWGALAVPRAPAYNRGKRAISGGRVNCMETNSVSLCIELYCIAMRFTFSSAFNA